MYRLAVNETTNHVIAYGSDTLIISKLVNGCALEEVKKIDGRYHMLTSIVCGMLTVLPIQDEILIQNKKTGEISFYDYEGNFLKKQAQTSPAEMQERKLKDNTQCSSQVRGLISVLRRALVNRSSWLQTLE